MTIASRSLDYLTGSPLTGEEADHDELIRSIVERKWAVLIGAACVAITAVVAFFILDATWPLIWLAADVLLTVARWTVMSTAAAQREQSHRRHGNRLAFLTLLWSGVFGVAMLTLIWSENLPLLITGCVLTISVSSAITYRNAAVPRTAVLAICLILVPFLIGVVTTLAEQQWIVLVIGIPLFASSYSLTKQNHSILVRLINAERQARALAHTDVLTGLPNRLSFLNHKEHVVPSTGASGGYAYMCLDLDGFKKINDTHGHPAGDLLLKMVAERLRKCTRASDIAFRIGGDEFIVYMPTARADECSSVAARIIDCMSDPFALSDRLSVTVGCSAGSACLQDNETSATVLEAADAALYKAKAAGRSRHVHAA